jgi:Ca2+-binding EF-hand superfamily protein
VSITDIAAAPCGFHCMNRDVFDSIDRDSDHRLRRGEFAEGCKAVGMQLTALEIENEFKAADKNGGGFVLFEEFTLWCAQRQVIQDDWEAQEEAAVAEAA